MTTEPMTYDPADFPPGLLAIPAVDWMWTESAESFMALSQHLPPGSHVAIARGLSASPAANRNQLAETFLANPSLKWILYIDSDMTPDPHTALALLSRQVAAIGALYFMRQEPHRMAAGKSLGEPITFNSTGIREMDYIGAGCLFLRRKVIEALEYPWFDHPAPGVGEDLIFCKKVRELGCTIYVDLDLCVGHMHTRRVGKEEAYLFQASPRGKEALAGPRPEPRRQVEAIARAYQPGTNGSVQAALTLERDKVGS